MLMLQRLMGILAHSRFLGEIWCIADGYILLIVLIWGDGVHLVHLQLLEGSVESGGNGIHKAKHLQTSQLLPRRLGMCGLGAATSGSLCVEVPPQTSWAALPHEREILEKCCFPSCPSLHPP